MNIWIQILGILNLKMKTPEIYGDFHLAFLIATVFCTVFLCIFFKNITENGMRKMVLTVSIIVMLLEVYKQIVYNFSYTNGMITFHYQWYIFPFQFCSTPMYVGLLAGIVKKGRLQEALYSYLATYAVFAGLCVMLYPVDVFIDKIGINFQTMICHGSMIVIGIFLLYTRYVKVEHKTILKAMPVFIVVVCIAVGMNEIAYQTGLTEYAVFNMFFISPYCEPSLPVYSLIQKTIPFPWCLLIYIVAFTLASYLIVLLSIMIQKLAKMLKDKKSIFKALRHKQKIHCLWI